MTITTPCLHGDAGPLEVLRMPHAVVRVRQRLEDCAAELPLLRDGQRVHVAQLIVSCSLRVEHRLGPLLLYDSTLVPRALSATITFGSASVVSNQRMPEALGSGAQPAPSVDTEGRLLSDKLRKGVWGLRLGQG